LSRGLRGRPALAKHDAAEWQAAMQALILVALPA